MTSATTVDEFLEAGERCTPTRGSSRRSTPSSYGARDRGRCASRRTEGRLLDRDGFVGLERAVLEPGEAKPLRDRFLDRCPAPPVGFHSDLTVADRPYRQWVSELIAEVLDESRPRPLRRSRTVPPQLRLQVARVRAAVCTSTATGCTSTSGSARAPSCCGWPSQDIDGHNGQFRALRGSHRLDPSLRGTDLTAPWLRHEEAIDRRLVSLPVTVGEALVFSNAVVHCSYPNNTDDPRIAVAVGMRPEGRPLVHFRRQSDALVVRYDVDESFLLDYTPQELIEAAPALPIVEEVPLDATDLSADDCVRRSTDRTSLVSTGSARMSSARCTMPPAPAGVPSSGRSSSSSATTEERRRRGRALRSANGSRLPGAACAARRSGSVGAGRWRHYQRPRGRASPKPRVGSPPGPPSPCWAPTSSCSIGGDPRPPRCGIRRTSSGRRGWSRHGPRSAPRSTHCSTGRPRSPTSRTSPAASPRGTRGRGAVSC